ncbi:uncharacterized protein LOC125228514 [Leguminivora glycinivorella]|uniref:uncharacterized protein LOC125228514 n=1 Tax=Leguminivora glycinivorella TaxID=1035111 RepID=UPI00200D1F5F|nr:uncharacterized protein LOC125228514 [Leguminivora glycinivorella]
MNPCRQNIALIIVFTLSFDHRTAAPNVEINPVQFSDEFVDFLQNMESRVYKYRQKYVEPSTTSTEAYYILWPTAEPVTTKSVNTVRKSSNSVNGILMMKLVAFYENKYTLNPVVPTTTNAPFPVVSTPEQRGVMQYRAIQSLMVI